MHLMSGRWPSSGRDHPSIQSLEVFRSQTVEAVFSAADEQGDLGDLPYVWFTISCGGKPTVGVVRGKRNGTSVRASIPRPAPSACNLELRVSDAQNIDSNTLKAGGL